jgi:ribosomal protein L29
VDELAAERDEVLIGLLELRSKAAKGTVAPKQAALARS